MSAWTNLDPGAENRTPPFRLRRSSSDSAAMQVQWSTPGGGSKPAAGGRPPLSPLPTNFSSSAYARSPAVDGSCTPLSLWSGCSDVPTPESDGTASSPSQLGDSDSPWSPPSPRRAAWLRASPTTKTARRVDALLTLATRCIATGDEAGEDEVPTPAATPVAEAAPARRGQSPDMPDSLKRAVANYALWKARSEALQAIGQEKRVAASVAGMQPPLATPPAHIHAPARQAAADLSPETAALVTQSHSMQQELLLSQLNTARSSKAQLRTDLQLAEARAQKLQLALDAAKQAHISDLDAARATLLVCDDIIQEAVLANGRLRRHNDRLRSRVTSLKQAAAAYILRVVAARVRPVACVTLDDGTISCTVVLRLRL